MGNLPNRPPLLRYFVKYEVPGAAFTDRDEAARWAQGHGGVSIEWVAPDEDGTFDRCPVSGEACEACGVVIWDDDDPSLSMHDEDGNLFHVKCVPAEDDGDDEPEVIQ